MKVHVEPELSSEILEALRKVGFDDLADRLVECQNRFTPDSSEPWHDDDLAVDCAKSSYEDEGKVEVGDGANLSYCEEGVWVSAWVFIDKEELQSVLMQQVHGA